MSQQSPVTPVAVAAIQMTSGPDVAANLAAAGALLERAAREGARVAALPENFSFMGRADADKRAVGERDGDGPVQQFLAERARALGLWIVGGTTPISQQPGERVAVQLARRRRDVLERVVPGSQLAAAEGPP